MASLCTGAEDNSSNACHGKILTCRTALSFEAQILAGLVRGTCARLRRTLVTAVKGGPVDWLVSRGKRWIDCTKQALGSGMKLEQDGNGPALSYPCCKTSTNVLVGQHSPSRPKSAQASFAEQVPGSGGPWSQQSRKAPWTETPEEVEIVFQDECEEWRDWRV